MVDISKVESLNAQARVEIAGFCQVHHISVGQPETINEAFENFLNYIL